MFLPPDPAARRHVQSLFEETVREEGQIVLGWRDVPTDNRFVGASAVAVQPAFGQIFIGRGAELAERATLPERAPPSSASSM